MLETLYDAGLRMSELNALALIRRGCTDPEALAQRMGTTWQAAGDVLRRLRRKGLVQGRLPTGVSLSAEGTQTLRALRQFFSGGTA